MGLIFDVFMLMSESTFRQSLHEHKPMRGLRYRRFPALFRSDSQDEPAAMGRPSSRGLISTQRSALLSSLLETAPEAERQQAPG